MAQLLTLSKAARLVGIKRDTLQEKIRQGEISTFEGLLDADDLLRLYPKTQIHDEDMLHRVNVIKDQAVNKSRDTEESEHRQLSKRLTLLRDQLAAEYKTNLALMSLLRSIETDLEQCISITDVCALKTKIHDTLLHAQQLGESNRSELTRTDDGINSSGNANIVRLLPSQHSFRISPNESVLDAALKAGENISYGCNNGSCGLCKAQVISGLTRQIRFHECRLSESEKLSGVIYTCAYSATTDLVLDTKTSQYPKDIPPQTVTGVILGSRVSGATTEISMKTPPEQRLRFLAGQNAEFRFSPDQVVCLPIASCPCDDRRIQVHIPSKLLAPQGAISAKQNDNVTISGPMGDFILDTSRSRPIIFVTSDQGFGALKALIEQALALDMEEPIYLYWFVRQRQDLYYSQLCRAWMDALDGFFYEPVIIKPRKEILTATENVTHDIRFALEYIDDKTPHLSLNDFYLAIPSDAETTAREFLAARGVPARQTHLRSI